MIKLYHVPLSRSVRVLWLLEELALPYQLEMMALTPESLKSPTYLQVHPIGKVPAIQDGELTMFESGAIVEYLLERYGNGRLAPAPGSPQRGTFLQWVHFAEATAMPPLSDVFVQTMRPEAKRIPAVLEEAQAKLGAVLRMLEQAVAGKSYLLGNDFSAADIMTGYMVAPVNYAKLLSDRYPSLIAYLGRLQQRPAFQKAMQA